MTAAQFEAAFDLICDKVGSPYFSAAEKDNFINRAQLSLLDDSLFPKRRSQDKKDADVYGFDNQTASMQALQPLVVYTPVAIINEDGKSYVRFSAITNASTRSVYRVMNVYLPEDTLNAIPQYSARYVPSINTSQGVYAGLRFGNPTSVKTGIYSIGEYLFAGTPDVRENGITFLPTLNVADEVAVEFIKVPASFSISGGVTCELDQSVHNEILFRALQLAGISIREDFFYQAMNLEQQKEA
jgi:hypothetical protein